MLANTGTAKEIMSPRTIRLAMTNIEGRMVYAGELGNKKWQIHQEMKAVK
jgi:hypothetical protein